MAARRRSGRIGLALAGGGPLGGIYEVGALLALADSIDNLDCTALDVYVGVSSGGFVAAALANGVSPAQMYRLFIADGRDKWGLGFLITADQVPGKRSPGSLSWGGINNTFFWIDPARGIAGVIMMQYLPFADAKALAVYDTFERGAYRLVTAER